MRKRKERGRRLLHKKSVRHPEETSFAYITQLLILKYVSNLGFTFIYKIKDQK